MADHATHPSARQATHRSADSVEPAHSPRQCGACSVCCTAMNVTPLAKPAGTPCVHQTASGCGNYENRPEVCRVWHCLWIRDDGRVLADHHRPDRLGLFFTATEPNPISGSQALIAHQTRPDAASEPEARRVIDHLRRFAPVRILPYRRPQPTAAPTQLTLTGRTIES